MLTYYQILGVPEDASLDDIKSAFKQQALKFHPDRHQGDPAMEEIFKELNTAYQTLSNSYSRHRYDMTLRYGSFTPPPPPTSEPPPKYRRRYRPPVPKPPTLTSRENLKATLYAFLFALIVGGFVKAGIWASDRYKAMEREKLLTERREVFGKAQQAFETDNLKECFTLMSGMGMFFETERDMREYKDMLLNNILTRAATNINNGHFQRGLALYSILENFPIGNSLQILLNKATAHKGLGNHERAIYIYNQLYMTGYRTTSFFVEMGDVHSEGLQDHQSALQYYEKASNLAAEEYASTFGEAYPVMISARHIPKHHFKLFMKLANAYFLTGDYEKSIRSTVWTKEIWPDSVEHYIISGKSHVELGEFSQACVDFQLAQQLDSSFSSPLTCGN